jgi:serine/threonine-protein kinase
MSPATPIEPERWRRIEGILDQALDLPDELVADFLDRSCAADRELRREVEELLAAATRADAREFLEQGAAELARPLLDGVEEAPPPPAEWESAVGPWRIVREVGRGGMGAVYLAERADGAFEQRVALKLIKRGLDTDEILARFRQERQILARLEHPGIARLVDGGAAADGRPYLAMEFVEGEPLTAYCRRQGLGLEGVLRLFTQACVAVEYAHRNLVVHRDLKPGNILVTAEGVLKLLDFGIAKLLSAPGAAGETLTLGPRMTPHYAAPEQVRGDPPTTATDVYALGVILYELLAGVKPYRWPTATVTELERAILEEDPEPPTAALRRGAEAPAPAWRDGLPGDLDAIVLQALRKEPARRYPSAEALREDLERFLADLPVRAATPTLGYRARKLLRRRRGAVAAGALVAVSLAAGLAATAWQARVAARERDHALQEARKATEIKDFTLGLFRLSDPGESRGAEITARDLLARGVERVDRELAGEPAVRAEMLQVLASIHHALGEYGRAESLSVRAVEVARPLGPSHPQLAASLHWLGIVRRERARFVEARQALIEALDIRRTLGGERQRSYSETLGELAMTYRREGRLDSAEALLRKVVEIDEEVLGSDHEEYATDLDLLGVVLAEQDRSEEAWSLFRTALDVRERRLGHVHPHVASSLANVATASRALGRYAESDSLYREALRVRIQTMGPDHVETARTYANYAELKRDLGDHAASFELFEKALEIERRVLGPDHPDVSRDANNLAIVYYQRAQYPQALERFREALASRHKTLPPDDRGSLTMEHNIGCVLRNMGRYAEAERALRAARERRRRALGAQHLDIANSDHHLGILLHWTGRHGEAEPLLRAALALRTSLAGDSHQVTAQTAEALATLLRDRGRARESQALYARAVAINAKVFPEPGLQSADAFVGLGRLLWLTGRVAEAEPWLKRGAAARQAALGTEDARTAEALVTLGLCRDAQAEPAEAESLLALGLPALQRLPDRRDPLAAVGARSLARLRKPGGSRSAARIP